MNITIIKNWNWFLAKCTQIDWAFAEGDTKFEAFYNLIDVVKMITDYKWIKLNSISDEFNIPLTLSV